MRRMPSVGDDVHYVAYGTPGGEFEPGKHRAAKITEVPPYIHPESTVSIVVFNPIGLIFQQHIPFDPTGRPGTWHWPEPPVSVE
jgi:hypothetical protein